MPGLRALELVRQRNGSQQLDINTLGTVSEFMQSTNSTSIVLLNSEQTSPQSSIKDKQSEIKAFWAGEQDKGKMYEYYVGYIFEKDGYYVQYIGRKQGNKDMGIDLACHKGHYTLMIQCKYHDGAKGTTSVKCIHQLYGACREYALDNPSEIVIGTLHHR
jgi:hypothetical protein